MFLFFTLAFVAEGQFTEVRAGFDPTTGKATGQTFTVDGKTFDIFSTASGALYVQAVAKSGRNYAVWVYTPLKEQHDGRTVYQTRTGKYCVYKLTAAGYPFPVWLKKE